MTSNQEAKLNMYHAVITHCDANPAIIITVPAFSTILTNLKGFVTGIEATAQSEVQVISGITVDKQTLRDELCKQATDLAAVVFAYASSVANNTLKQQANFSFTDLKRIKDDELAPNCRNIHNAANDNLAALFPYGVTAASLTAFNTLIDNYDAAVPTPRNAASLRASYRSTLETKFKEADKVIKEQLDKTAVQFKAANIEFYNTYKNNRIIIDPGTSSTQISGTVVDGNKGEPVVGVTVEFLGLSLSDNTSIDGAYSVKNPTPGIYTVKARKAGYQDNTIPNVELTLGQTTTLNIKIDIIPV